MGYNLCNGLYKINWDISGSVDFRRYSITFKRNEEHFDIRDQNSVLVGKSAYREIIQTSVFFYTLDLVYSPSVFSSKNYNFFHFIYEEIRDLHCLNDPRKPNYLFKYQRGY